MSAASLSEGAVLQGLDPGIRDEVEQVRTAGFETTGSCQGGPGHAFVLPTIQVARAEGETLHETGLRLLSWCQEVFGPCTVSVHYLCQKDRVMPESFLQVELWLGVSSGHV